MATTVKIRRSGTATATPSSLEHGELAINYADKTLYFKDSTDAIQSFVFQSYALASHTHAASDITSGTLDSARLDATLAALAGVTTSADEVIYATGSDTFATTALSAFGRSLIDDADAAAARTTLGVQPTNDPNFTGAVSLVRAVYPVIELQQTGSTGVGQIAMSGDEFQIRQTQAYAMAFFTDNQSRLTISSTGTATFAGQIVGQAGMDVSGAATFANTGNVVPVTVTNTGTANSFVVNDASGDTTPFVIDASGRVGIGTGSPGAELEVADSSSDNDVRINLRPNGSTLSQVGASSTQTFIDSIGARSIVFLTNANTRLTISSTGTATFAGQILADDIATAGSVAYAFDGDADTGVGRGGADTLSLVTAGSERVRVDASGNVLVGQSTTTDPAGTNTNGIAIAPDYISISRSANACFAVNRKVDDGLVVAVFQDGALEGSISVSGNTVSYNAFCGSHWAQLIDGSRPAILRGTVLETIDEMCEWPDGKSDRLPRVKVSDTPRSRRVYGVFMAWDEDYASTGDMYATALGAYMVRVSGVVQSGDLLESAGDGTARTQSDDIVRSSTIGKVSSTHRVAEYDDGSYLVPCVLMCG